MMSWFSMLRIYQLSAVSQLRVRILFRASQQDPGFGFGTGSTAGGELAAVAHTFSDTSTETSL